MALPFLALGLIFTGCEDEEDFDAPSMSLSAVSMAFDASGGAETISLVSTRAWTATTDADWISVGPASGEASTSSTSVTISVLADTEYDREATVYFTFNAGTYQSTLGSVTVSQVGELGEEDKGDGSYDNPYTVEGALEIINAGEYTDDMVYVKGIVSSIDDIDTSSYGNATYYLSDDDADNELYVYRGYYLDGAKFTSEDQLAEGDVLVILGTLTMYYSTPEVTTGSTIISINGGSGSGSGDDSSDSTENGWDNGDGTVTDLLDYDVLGLNQTSYTDFSGVAGYSGAVYAGNAAGGVNLSDQVIQLRTTNSNAGIVSTTSGGTLCSVTVTWNSNTGSRTLDIYGSTSAYTDATELYDSSTQGTKLGSLSYDGSSSTGTLEIDESYQYVGIRSNSSALYLDEIQIVWSDSENSGSNGGSDDGSSTGYTFSKASSISSGNYYIMVADGEMATPISSTYSYGYLYTETVTITDDALTLDSLDDAFIFTATDGGYTIMDYLSRYMWGNSEYKSYNFTTSPSSGYVWTVDFQSDDSAKISCVDTGQYIQYSGTYSSYGLYTDSTGTMPTLYEYSAN